MSMLILFFNTTVVTNLKISAVKRVCNFWIRNDTSCTIYRYICN